MQNIEPITSINDLHKDFLLKYIADLPREERAKVKKYIEANPAKNAQGQWAMVRAYIWNTYFVKKPSKNKTPTFAEQLDQILNF